MFPPSFLSFLIVRRHVACTQSLLDLRIDCDFELYIDLQRKPIFVKNKTTKETNRGRQKSNDMEYLPVENLMLKEAQFYKLIERKLIKRLSVWVSAMLDVKAVWRIVCCRCFRRALFHNFWNSSAMQNGAVTLFFQWTTLTVLLLILCIYLKRTLRACAKPTGTLRCSVVY